MIKSDTAWNKFGEVDPYYSVITDETFRKKNLDEKTLNQFFKSGDDFIRSIIGAVHDHIHPNFHSKCAMDFGCGVGRLVIPLRKYSDRVFGVDVSRLMLDEAAKNCLKSGISDVRFSDDILKIRESGETFDLIHSYNVFQHIPHRKGFVLIELLADLLNKSGIGIIHIPFHCTSTIRLFFSSVMKHVPSAHNFWNIYKNREWFYPYMQMNVYNLNILFRILDSKKCDICHTQFIRQGDYETVILFFRKLK